MLGLSHASHTRRVCGSCGPAGRFDTRAETLGPGTRERGTARPLAGIRQLPVGEQELPELGAEAGQGIREGELAELAL